MKKRFLALFIALPALLSACGEVEYVTEIVPEYEGSLSYYEKEVISIERDPKATVVADFEEWAPSFQTMCVVNNFGRVTRNEDPTYVKTGKYSALLQPLGNQLVKSTPICYWPLTALECGVKLSNLTDYATIEFDFYNTTNYKIKATVGLVTAVRSCADIAVATGLETSLSKNAWTHVSYTIDPAILSKSKTPIDNVPGIYISFPNSKTRDFETCPTVYVDDVILMKK